MKIFLSMHNIMINRCIINCLCNRIIPTISCLVYTHNNIYTTITANRNIFFPQLVISITPRIDPGAYRRRVSLLIDRQGRLACCVNRVINPYRGSGPSSYRLSADTLRTSENSAKENNTILCQTAYETKL